MTNNKNIRTTVAGILIRFSQDGTPLLAFHRSPKAGANYTTVGGGVQPFESYLSAMERELREEYGYRSLNGIHIIELGIPGMESCSSGGGMKRYHWYLIIDHHMQDVTASDPHEVIEIHWHPLDRFSTIANCFSEGKQHMITTAIEHINKYHAMHLARRHAA